MKLVSRYVVFLFFVSLTLAVAGAAESKPEAAAAAPAAVEPAAPAADQAAVEKKTAAGTAADPACPAGAAARDCRMNEMLRRHRAMAREMDRLAEDFFARPFGFPAVFARAPQPEVFSPRCEIREDDQAFELTMEIPGVAGEDISVTVERGVLTVRGEKAETKESKDKSCHAAERRYGFFQRSFTLPDQVDEDKITATGKDGVLKIVLPKSEKPESKAKKIPVKS